MGTDVAVVIAYRDMGVPERRRAFHYVHDWYTTRGYPVVVEAGESDASFTRASAINTAIGRTDAAVIVQADPDNLVSPVALHMAAVLSGQRPVTQVGPDDCELWGPDAPGGVVVFSRSTWERCGRFDERFGLWGGDDAAFAYAAEAFCGPAQRIAGDITHLWHPILPQAEIGSAGYVEQFAILAQYRDAAAVGPAQVRALVDARRPR